jgi:MSHA biogenesis protein MshO
MRGFTLVELVVAMTIGAMIVGFTVMLLRAPTDAYLDQSERSRLTEALDNVSNRLDTDLRTALPNSVRIRNAGTRSIIEFIQYENVGFFRTNGELGDGSRELDFGTAADPFSIFGRLDPNQTAPYFVGRLAFGNRGVTGWNAYAGTNVITPANSPIKITPNLANDEETLSLPAGFKFAIPLPLPTLAPTNRIFAISSPVTYICNSATGFVRRYSNYAITAAIPTAETSAQLASAEMRVLATNATACRVRCDAAGTANVNVCQKALVTQISFTRTATGGNESIQLLHQAALDNRLL